jgi:hypothetical protein
MGRLDSQRSLPVVGEVTSGLSSTAKKLRLAVEQKVALLTPTWFQTSLVSDRRRFEFRPRR